jgi:hypothetical protein
MNVTRTDPILSILLPMLGGAQAAQRTGAVPFGPLPAWDPARARAAGADPFVRQTLFDTVGAFGGSDAGSAILADPTLSIVDKLIALMAFIEDRHQRRAEAKMSEIQALSEGGEAGGGSLEIETTRLKRMLDTLSQIKDILRGAIEKYTESENNAAQSIRA